MKNISRYDCKGIEHGGSQTITATNGISHRYSQHSSARLLYFTIYILPGRLLRFIFFLYDNFWDALFFIQRRIPYWPCTMSKRNYLNSMYGRTSLYKQEVKDCFKELNIRGSREQFKVSGK